MNTVKPFVLTHRIEEILKTIHFYRFMTAQDVAWLLYSPSSLTYVRGILSSLSGGADFQTNHYLYRFQLPVAKSGGIERIFTLGSKGREFIANEVGLPVDWYFRPFKIKHLSYGQIVHDLVLTRFCVAAAAWAAKQPDFKLIQTRICYELARTLATVQVIKEGKTGTFKVIPDAWLLFERLKNGAHDKYFPVLLEIDRGMEYQRKLKHHLRSRIEFIRSGAYSKLFETEAVMIAYVTTGDLPEYRETRRRAMCNWTNEVLKELGKTNWSSIFRFTSVVFGELHGCPLFDEAIWYRPDSPSPVPLFTP